MLVSLAFEPRADSADAKDVPQEKYSLSWLATKPERQTRPRVHGSPQSPNGKHARVIAGTAVDLFALPV
jgi:hydroxyacyl-ACP dehydratase HTD2-like protein with hotdog domain